VLDGGLYFIGEFGRTSVLDGAPDQPVEPGRGRVLDGGLDQLKLSGASMLSTGRGLDPPSTDVLHLPAPCRAPANLVRKPDAIGGVVQKSAPQGVLSIEMS
jgi:hypothetical protein